MKWSNLSPLRVALIDDHPLVRSGIAARLGHQRDVVVCGLYDSGQALLAGLENAAADVLVMDYSLRPGEMDGLGLVQRVRRLFPQVRLLMYSSHEAPATAALCLRAGARGFLGKSGAADELVRAIYKVANEQIYLPALMKLELESVPVEESLTDESTPQTLVQYAQLSPREQEVLRCTLDGMTVTQISDKFLRSPKTISAQKQAALRKLGVRTDAELFKITQRLEDEGLLSPSAPK